jgi:hypothetical protein
MGAGAGDGSGEHEMSTLVWITRRTTTAETKREYS